MKFAVIDIGSNTIKLNIYKKRGRKFEETASFTERAALASFKADGVLSDEGVSALINIINGYRAICRKKRVKYVFPYATQSLRGISNTDDVCDRVLEATGLTVDVISGEDEARLGFRSFVSEFGTERSGMLSDMGGGSTELTVFEKGSVLFSASLPFGSLSIAKECGSGIIPDGETVAEIAKRVEAAMKDAGFDCSAETLYATGGTASGAFRLCRLYGLGSKNEVSVKDLETLINRAQNSPGEFEPAVKELLPDRYDSILPGIAAYAAICRAAGVKNVIRSKTTCRYGYASELFEKGFKNV